MAVSAAAAAEDLEESESGGRSSRSERAAVAPDRNAPVSSPSHSFACPPFSLTARQRERTGNSATGGING